MKPFTTERLEPLIFTVRGQRVLLDADLARLYDIPTFRFNEAFRRNRHRFPDDFAFQLTGREFHILRSQFAISSAQAPDSSAILKRIVEIDKTLLQHDAALRDVYQKLLPLLQPAPVPPKRRIGFQ